MDRLRVGFIGTGRISDLHALEYLAHERTEIVAVCDANLPLARERGARWGVRPDRIFAQYEDLLAVEEVDLVEILLPHHLHRDATVAAARAGKHISCQKPMALNLAEADEMVAAAAAAGVVLKVFENFLFYPPVQRAKALIEAGEIGEPRTIRIKSNAGVSETQWEVPDYALAWRFDPERCGGGPLVWDDGLHKFALAWHFFGLAEETHAWIGETDLGGGAILDAPAIVSWKFPGNRYGSFEVVWSPELQLETQQYAQDDRIEITGTRGVIWITRGHAKMMDLPPVILHRDRQTLTFSDMPVAWSESFVRSTRQGIEALLTGEAPVLTGEQGREILRFALAAQESARAGRAIRLA